MDYQIQIRCVSTPPQPLRVQQHTAISLEMPPTTGALSATMSTLTHTSRPSSRCAIAALRNSSYPLISSTHRAAFTSSPQHALPSPSESMFRSGSTVGGPPSTYFQRSSLPANTIVKFVPQQTAWIVERMGRFSRVLEPGLAILVPVIDRIAYVKSLKENAMEIPSQSAITADNVTLELDGVLYTRVFDPYKASYGVEDADYAISQLAQTTMRSEIGQLTLDHVLKERQALNTNITQAINEASADWGIRCLRYEIRDIHAPGPVVEAMHRQVTAERSKRAEILDSEGQRQSAINIAEGRKQSVVLSSEAVKMEKINSASGEAEAILLKAKATANGIDAVARAIAEGKQSAQGAVSLSVAEKYVEAFGKLAKEGTSVVVPGNVGDIGGMIATAMSVYGNVAKAQAGSMGQKVIESGKGEEERDYGQGVSQTPGSSSGGEGVEEQAQMRKKEMARSMLESFDRTQQRH
ncbi:Synaptotagmin-like protein 2 [Extremus antarcticus]|uniref:Synaptotagmin-like protein 2 n=1 Tax=Extremus antarcticus TaxID=702011 RepID=A0AAJ0D6U5_9PEZI|nr:Synaptotagmin-like protein 2 [Extremus antarcticus]